MKYYKCGFQPINIFFYLDPAMYELLHKVFNIIEVDVKEYKICDEKYSITIHNNISYEIDLCYNDLLVMNKSIDNQMLILFLTEVFESLISNMSSFISFHSSGFLIKKNLVLFTNKSGSGKSTALMSCLSKIERSEYFADDRIVVNEKLEISGVTNALKVKSGTVKLLDIHYDDLLGPYDKIDLDSDKIKYWFYFPKNTTVKTSLSSYEYNIKIILIHYEADKSINVIKLNGVEKIDALVNNCYDIKKNTGVALSIIKQLSQKSDIYQVNYSKISDIVSFIMTFDKDVGQ